MENHIRFVRKKHYWLSQDWLASSVGISREALRLIENGKSDPRVSVALAIADILCVSVTGILMSFFGKNLLHYVVLYYF